MKSLITIICLSITTNLLANYPAHWWQEIPESDRYGSWEILPQEAKAGELILSKRNELGAFSNLSHTPFRLDGVLYASVESLWQMMKYPDPSDHRDPRNNISAYDFKRHEIISMYGFDCKKAGDHANAINMQYGLGDFMSYQSRYFHYKDMGEGSLFHYQLIYRAIYAKILQNPSLKKLLLRTKGLRLVPDHHLGSNKPQAYKYHMILMKIRESL